MHGYIDKFVLMYLDDVLVYSDNKDYHEAHLQKVLDQLCKHKLQANQKNCEFSKMHMKYGGYVVGSNKLCIDDDNVAAVSSWEPPANIEGV